LFSQSARRVRRTRRRFYSRLGGFSPRRSLCAPTARSTRARLNFPRRVAARFSRLSRRLCPGLSACDRKPRRSTRTSRWIFLPGARLYSLVLSYFRCEFHKRNRRRKKSALEDAEPAKSDRDRERQRERERWNEKKCAPRATCRGKSSSPSPSHSTPELTSNGEISLHKVCVRATSEDLMDSMSCASFEEEEEGIVVVVVVVIIVGCVVRDVREVKRCVAALG